jgi:hypothetical protein
LHRSKPPLYVIQRNDLRHREYVNSIGHIILFGHRRKVFLPRLKF